MRPVTCQLVRVLLETDALDWLAAPSRIKEQVMLVKKVSVAVKLRLTVVTLKKVLLLGLSRVTTGRVVPTVKFLIADAPRLPDWSLHVTVQRWRPSGITETGNVVVVPLLTDAFVWFRTPSM